jgi:hypothetical protein
MRISLVLTALPTANEPGTQKFATQGEVGRVIRRFLGFYAPFVTVRRLSGNLDWVVPQKFIELWHFLS